MSQLPLSRQLRLDQLCASWFIAGALLLEGAVLPIQAERKALLPSLPIAEIPVTGELTPLTASPSAVTATRYIAIDLDSASVLTEHHSTEPQQPASALKLLTALTAVDLYALDQEVVLTETDLQGLPDSPNELHWQPGEVLNIQSLLASLLIKSDNYAAEILANHAPGGREAFLLAMSHKAQQLHLNPTLQLVNPSGLDAVDQKLSAQDLVWLGTEAVSHDMLKALMAKKTQVVTGEMDKLPVSHSLQNTNQLLWSELPILAGKTGTTDQAGEVLLSLFQIQNHRVMIVVMGSVDRYADTRQIFNWIQTHYHWQSWEEFAYNT